MEYNSQREKLIIPEYGRNVQKMIQHCMEIPDRVKRTRTAELIVNVMAQMNPKVKESVDYKQKMWDHLCIISDFKLDVDNPYPPPPKDLLYSKPKRINYSEGHIRFRHYGKNIERIIEKAISYPEGQEKEALIRIIANHLKKSYLNWNRNSVEDDLILEHLKVLSNHRLQVGDDFKLNNTNEILARNKKKYVKSVSSGGSNYSNNKYGGSNKGRKKQG